MSRYQKDVMQWAKSLQCNVRQKPDMPGMMYVEFGYIEAPTIRNQRDYFINLHELGHYFNGHTQGRPPKQNKKHYFENGVLRSEAEAWEFAFMAARPTVKRILPETRRYIWDTCLGSYYKAYLDAGGRPGQRLGNGNRHWVSFSYDKPDDYFTSVVETIQGNLTDFRIQYTGAVK